MHLQHALALLLLGTFLLGKAAYAATDNECSQKWVCNREERCIRVQKNAQNVHTYNSQGACRLVCGQYGALWPRPTGYTLLGQTLFSINPSDLKFNITQTSIETADYLRDISNIFLSKLLRQCGDRCNVARSEKQVSVRLLVQTNETEITWNTDESYRLDVITSGDQVTVRIVGPTIFGVRHGLETLQHLMTPDICEAGLLLIKSARIEDRPAYRHRGILLDTARNFISIPAIKRTIDGMGSSKFNVFHWHISDTQSFPMEIPTMPQFTIYGAYGSNFTYSPNDIGDVVWYAKLRGIRVIMEIDAPSHAGNGWNWGPEYGIGDLAVCVDQQPWRKFCIQPPCGQINPVNQYVFGVFREIYKHIQSIVPAHETIHMGGDEVFLGCWNSSQEIVDFMHDHGLGRETKDFIQLWAEFHQATLRVWDEERGQDLSSRRETPSVPNKVILYSSELTNPEHIRKYLQNDRYIIQTWVESTASLPQKLLDLGYELIMSTKNAWYFDHGFWGNTRFYTWKMAYDNHIPVHKGVLGGEACIWTEYIDENNLDQRLWPRACSVAERLWSNPSTPSTKAAERLNQHRKRLQSLGIKPEPIEPGYCSLNEGQCL